MQKLYFFYDSCVVLVKNVSLERWIQLMIGGFKTVSLAWKKIAVIGYTWVLFMKDLIATRKECLSPRILYSLYLFSQHIQETIGKQLSSTDIELGFHYNH